MWHGLGSFRLRNVPLRKWNSESRLESKYVIWRHFAFLICHFSRIHSRVATLHPFANVNRNLWAISSVPSTDVDPDKTRDEKSFSVMRNWPSKSYHLCFSRFHKTVAVISHEFNLPLLHTWKSCSRYSSDFINSRIFSWMSHCFTLRYFVHSFGCSGENLSPSVTRILSIIMAL